MKKAIAFLWNSITRLGVLYLIGMFFCLVVPVIMLIEMVSTGDAPTGIKVGFAFCLVAVVVFFIVRNQLKKLAERISNGVLKEFVLALLLGMWWAFGIVVIIGISRAIGTLEAFWWRVGICFLVGSCFYIIHAAVKKRRDK